MSAVVGLMAGSKLVEVFEHLRQEIDFQGLNISFETEKIPWQDNERARRSCFHKLSSGGTFEPHADNSVVPTDDQVGPSGPSLASIQTVIRISIELVYFGIRAANA